MIVRVETIRKTNQYIVVDEIGKYIGKIDELSFIDTFLDKDPFEEDEYTWYYVDKQLLFLKIQENENS